MSVVMGALAAGAVKGAGDTATAAVKDAYGALKSAIRGRLEGKVTAEALLDEHEADPEAYGKALEKQLTQANVAQDPRIVALAETLLKLMESSKDDGAKYSVNLRGAQGTQVGDGNVQANTLSHSEQ